jgi:hypothetical protein
MRFLCCLTFRILRECKERIPKTAQGAALLLLFGCELCEREIEQRISWRDNEEEEELGEGGEEHNPRNSTCLSASPSHETRVREVREGRAEEASQGLISIKPSKLRQKSEERNQERENQEQQRGDEPDSANVKAKLKRTTTSNAEQRAMNISLHELAYFYFIFDCYFHRLEVCHFVHFSLYVLFLFPYYLPISSSFY